MRADRVLRSALWASVALDVLVVVSSAPLAVVYAVAGVVPAQVAVRALPDRVLGALFLWAVRAAV